MRLVFEAAVKFRLKGVTVYRYGSNRAKRIRWYTTNMRLIAASARSERLELTLLRSFVPLPRRRGLHGFLRAEGPFIVDSDLFLRSGAPIFALPGFLHFFGQSPLLIVWRKRCALAPPSSDLIPLLLTFDAVHGKRQQSQALNRN